MRKIAVCEVVQDLAAYPAMNRRRSQLRQASSERVELECLVGGNGYRRQFSVIDRTRTA
jgi:hypothetical protein